MWKTYHLMMLFGMVAFGAALVGCSKESAPRRRRAVVEEKVVVEEVEVPALSDKVTDTMAGLSETDRAVVLAQKVCPVSDDVLGLMGPPIKVAVKGRDVFLC